MSDGRCVSCQTPCLLRLLYKTHVSTRTELPAWKQRIRYSLEPNCVLQSQISSVPTSFLKQVPGRISSSSTSINIVDGEHDAPYAERVHWCVLWLTFDRRWRVELGQLKPTVAVRRSSAMAKRSSICFKKQQPDKRLKPTGFAADVTGAIVEAASGRPAA